jgi:hypothetical protein
VENPVLTRSRQVLIDLAVVVMKRYDVGLRVVWTWMKVEISDLGANKTASHPLLSGNFEILAGLEPAAVEKDPNVRWAQPGIRMPL